MVGRDGTAGIAVRWRRPRSAQTVTLDVLYAFPAFAKFHEPIAAEFMKRHPDIKIQFRAPAANYDEGHQTMLRQAMTNQLPDVYYSGFHLLAELVAHAGQAQPDHRGRPAAGQGRRRPGASANYADSVLALGKVDGKTVRPRRSTPRCRSSTSTSSW